MNLFLNIYLETKVREYNGEIKTNFLNNGMPKENILYSCISCITIDSVINVNKKNHPQVYLKECKVLNNEFPTQYF